MMNEMPELPENMEDAQIAECAILLLAALCHTLADTGNAHPIMQRGLVIGHELAKRLGDDDLIEIVEGVGCSVELGMILNGTYPDNSGEGN